MKKILINDLGYLENGTRIAVISKIKTWQKYGFLITILCPLNGKLFYEKQLCGVNFIVIPGCINNKNILILILELLKRNITAIFLLNRIRNKFDSVYSVSAVLDMVLLTWVLKIRDKDKVKWAVIFDNAVHYKNPEKPFIDLLSFIFHKISLALLKKADIIFAVTVTVREYLLKNGFPAEKIVTTSNAIETELIEESNEDPRFNTDALYVGRINKSKGIYDLVEAVKIIKNKHNDFQLGILGVGDSATLKKYTHRIVKEGLSQNIRFFGYSSGIEKYTIIKSSKLFLFLSKRESFSVALLEAVCSGLKAVAYDLKDSYHRIAYTNEEVIFVPKDDYSKAANEVLKIIASGNLTNHNGKKLLQEYRWDRIAEIEMKSL